MKQGQLREEEAYDAYDKVKKKEVLKDKLKKGYSQMAELNLKLAQEGLLIDREVYHNFVE